MKLDLELARGALEEAIRQSLEGMAFLDVETAEELTDFESSEEMFSAEISILKPLKVKIALVVSAQCARKWVESVYVDISSGVTDDTIRDVLAETLNTAAGCFMKGMLQASQSYELGIPRTWKGRYHGSDEILLQRFFTVLDEKMAVLLTKKQKKSTRKA